MRGDHKCFGSSLHVQMTNSQCWDGRSLTNNSTDTPSNKSDIHETVKAAGNVSWEKNPSGFSSHQKLTNTSAQRYSVFKNTTSADRITQYISCLSFLLDFGMLNKLYRKDGHSLHDIANWFWFKHFEASVLGNKRL